MSTFLEVQTIYVSDANNAIVDSNDVSRVHSFCSNTQSRKPRVYWNTHHISSGELEIREEEIQLACAAN